MKFILIFLQFCSATAFDFNAKTIRIIDGDTAKVSPKPGQVKSVRFKGIDAPEYHLPVELPNGSKIVVGQLPWGELSTAVLEKILPLDSFTTIKNTTIDKYNRIVGKIFLNNHDVNLEMIKLGWAVPYIICSGPECTLDFFAIENVEGYFKACVQARSQKIGVFDPVNPLAELPFEFRMRMLGKKPEKFVGDYRTRKLYDPDQYKKVDPCFAIFFYTKLEANRVGFY